jgi:DNA-binding transcriptional LysR family regulator
MAHYPRIKLQVLASNRRVDLIEEGVEVAIRVRTIIDTDATLTMRTLGKSRRILVASPAWAEANGPIPGPSALSSLPTLSMTEQPGEDLWELIAPDGAVHAVRHEPRIACGDFVALRAAAEAGLGVALLPYHSCEPALRSGRLIQLLPEYQAPEGTIYLVFTTRRGLPPGVRALIDFLAEQFRDDALFAGR